VPASPGPTVVHGDYNLHNVAFAPDPPARLVAIYDWELATVGDPLCDVAWMLTMWPDRADEAGTLLAMAGTVAQDGLPSRGEVAALYAERSGRSVASLGWYTVLALWRAAIGLETVLEQVLAGAADGTFAHELEIGVPELAARARAAAHAAT
jgi:aminoglycoside phosphotransferase (APT) family kinase protein